MIFTQQNRFLSLSTPLGREVLLLRGFSGREALSQLFSFQLDLVSENLNIDFSAIVGRRVTMGMTLADGHTQRFFNGVISRFCQLPSEGRLARYQAEMVPWLWLLSRTADCRIFQNKSTPDIVQQLCRKAGFTDIELRLQRTYEPREYCVQYQETTLHFILRLLEDDGIFFFFRHEHDKHILVLGDSPEAHKPCPQQSTVRYVAPSGQDVPREEDVVFSWQREQELRPTRSTLGSFHFKTPERSISGSADVSANQSRAGHWEWREYTGEGFTRTETERLARLRLQEQRVSEVLITGASNVRILSAGFRFALRDHERRDQNNEYVVTTIEHTAHEGGLYAGVGNQPAIYSNSFISMPAQTPFRPERVTPKPVMHGVQTAIVVGPSGENIYTDQYGRVKVQFHWDREGRRDQNTSCWIRVSQPWAGKSWGALFLPRIGQEVLVDFLEGDPDRPVITGRLYNAEQTPPYPLPEQKTQSGLKSRSSPNGGPDNFNEIRFEDKKGQEELSVHAERQLTVIVEQDESRTVGASRTTRIAKDDTETVGNNQIITIARQQQVSVADQQIVTIGGSQTTTVTQSRTVTVVQADTLTAGTTITITSGGAITITSGGPVTISSGGPVTMTAPLITLNTPVLKVTGMVQCANLVIAPG